MDPNTDQIMAMLVLPIMFILVGVDNLFIPGQHEESAAENVYRQEIAFWENER